MTDVFGDALQKLASSESVDRAQDSKSLTQPVDPADEAAGSLTNMEPCSNADDAFSTCEVDWTAPEADCEPSPMESSAAESPEKALPETMKALAWKKLIRIPMAHRRQSVAVVVLVCMAVLWRQDSASTIPAPTNESETDMTNVESLLRGFNMGDATRLRAPAEPVNQSVGDFDFTIPRSRADLSAESRDASTSSGSAAVAVYPDRLSDSGGSVGGSFRIPNATLQTASGSTQDSENTNGVRFTGRIQPLK